MKNGKILVKRGFVWYNVQSIATIAQLVEQAFRKRQVKGPNPFGGFLPNM